MRSVLLQFAFRRHLFNQVVTLSQLAWVILDKAMPELAVVMMVVSSAYCKTVPCIASNISPMYKENRRGDKILPWGTPILQAMLCSDELLTFMVIVQDLTEAEAVVEAHYDRSEVNRFLDITFRSGRHDYLYRGDLASGAIIAAVVERAKEYAIKRSIEAKKESPLSKDDLLSALEREYRENDRW